MIHVTPSFRAANDTPGYREWPSTSGLIRACWRVLADRDGTWTTGGAEYWGLVFSENPDGAVNAQVIGPSVRPRPMTVRAGDLSWGVDFEPHVVGRGVVKSDIIDGDLDLLTEIVGERWWFTLGGVRLPVPRHDELDAAVERMADAGALELDPTVRTVLDGTEVDLSDRTVRRQFAQTTGLRRGQVEQIRRARRAFALLQQGMSPAEAAAAAGYADQAHMTRQLRILTGSTPGALPGRDGFSMS